VTSELTPDRIRAALAENSGNIAATARELGVSRATLYRWMKAHAIGVERVVRAA
jgi:transcriptional regulator of acetoin/glycerol metabolism